MRVILYTSDDAPEHLRHAARILLPKSGLLPVTLHGADDVELRARTEAWFAEEGKKFAPAPAKRKPTTVSDAEAVQADPATEAAAAPQQEDDLIG